MSSFVTYFNIGFHHIVNWGALDHILFMSAIAVRYVFSDWKKMLIIVTAFTIGHATTLALAIFNWVHLNKPYIELGIALTIAVTAFSNLFIKKFNYKAKVPPIYYMALAFGLIHGLGFATDFVAIEGKGIQAALHLLYTNLGIEVGQLLFVLIVLIITFICLNILKFNRREYLLFTSGAIFGIAVQLVLQRLPF
jgi:hypothetical protein